MSLHTGGAVIAHGLIHSDGLLYSEKAKQSRANDRYVQICKESPSKQGWDSEEATRQCYIVSDNDTRMLQERKAEWEQE